MKTTTAPPTGSLIDWPDFAWCGWQRTSYGQFAFAKDGVRITLLEPDMSGMAELDMQAVGGRKMSRRIVRFPLPIEATKYNEAVGIIEGWCSMTLPELRWAHPRP